MCVFLLLLSPLRCSLPLLLHTKESKTKPVDPLRG